MNASSLRLPRRSARVLQSAVFLLLVTAVAACKPGQGIDIRRNEYQQKLQACRDSFAGVTRIPILGGGYIDTARFAFHVPTMKVTDEGACGAVAFVADFYWTGEKIIPNSPKFTGLNPDEIPPHWRLLQVAAELANRKLNLQCQAQFDPNKCPDPTYKAPVPPSTWPEHLIVRPNAYPGLEIWLDAVRDPRPTGFGFIMRDWKRWDGVTPRHVSCSADHVEFPIHTMTPAELEHLDFGQRTFPCEVWFNDFDFKGGAARISTGTEALREIVPALKALQKYLSDSIIKED
jgi:hypothetical protein